MANTIPLLVLGFLMALAGLSRFVWATAIVWILGGFGTWLIGNMGISCGPTDHIGASGLIFGWLAFLLVFGIFVRRFADIVIGLVVLLAYGGVLLGAMPVLGRCGGVSWQGHLCGAIAGVVAAYLVVRAGTQGSRDEKSRHCNAAPQDMSSPLAPVGIFDSGVGGLTVARAIIDQLPDEDIIYVGDTGHGPYGPLTIPEVRAHALAIGDDLVGRGVKALVIACNTASAACLRDARERYDVPVVEVILPAVRRAVATTRTGRIGVIGTKATINSHAYQDAFAAARDTEITAVACPRFVDFVERGVTSGRQVLGLAEGYLEPLQRAQVDTLVLGCTHYPLLSGLIQLAMGENVTLVSSAEETAKEVLRVLTERDLLRPHDAPPATRVFEATGDPDAFTKLAARFLGPAVTGVQPVHHVRID